MAAQRIDGFLVCGGKYHDMDFARLELLKILAENERIRVRVVEDYRDAHLFKDADFLMTYTCEVIPDEGQQDALAAYLNSGKRWFALHGTNSILHYRKGAGWEAPRTAPRFMDMLGSQFIAHPPIEPYAVRVSDPDHALVAGLDAFDANDELYLCELHGESRVLLEAHFNGEAEGFVQSDWHDDAPRPVLYLHPWGAGEVLYFTLGHARGRYDMQPLMDEYPHVERGSWHVPQYTEVIRRGIRWATGELGVN